MNSKGILTKLWDASVRLDNIVWLAGGVEGFTDDDFFEEVLLEAHAKASFMHESMHIFAGAPDWVTEDQDAFIEWMDNKGLNGFIVQATTPKPIEFHENGYTSCGFGMTSSTFFYVDTPADAVQLAVEWQETQISKWRAEAA